MYLSLALKAAWPWFTSGWPWPAKQSISTIHCHRSLRSSLYSSFLICVFFTVPQNLKPEGFLESSNLSFPNSTWFLLSKFSNFCWIKWIWLLGVYEVRVKEVVLWTEGVKTQLCYRFVPSQHQFQLSLWDSHCLTGWETRCVIPVSGRCLPASGPVPVRLARCHQTNCLMSVLPVFSIQRVLIPFTTLWILNSLRISCLLPFKSLLGLTELQKSGEDGGRSRSRAGFVDTRSRSCVFSGN